MFKKEKEKAEVITAHPLFSFQEKGTKEQIRTSGLF